MNGMLFLDAAALRREPDDLRAVLRDHVGTEKAATRIMLMLLQATHQGTVSHCVILPDAAAAQPDAGWNVKIVYEDEHRGATQAVAARRDRAPPFPMA